MENQQSAEEVIGSALSVPIGLIIGVADLLVQKEILSRKEIVAMVQHLTSSRSHGKNEAMVRMILESVMVHFEEKKPSSESKN